jgi:hypothetical protein
MENISQYSFSELLAIAEVAKRVYNHVTSSEHKPKSMDNVREISDRCLRIITQVDAEIFRRLDIPTFEGFFVTTPADIAKKIDILNKTAD